MQAAEILSHGGRTTEKELKEIAEMNVVGLLQAGLTLEQAETVIKMAAIELSRCAEEKRFIPKVPAVEMKNKGAKSEK